MDPEEGIDTEEELDEGRELADISGVEQQHEEVVLGSVADAVAQL